ncbi:MAG: histidinol-phosphatase [Bacteroidota bacterium]
MWADYHIHSVFCDGKSTHAELVSRGEALGLRSMGFASHGPLPFPCNWCMPADRLGEYVAGIRALNQQSPVEVYAGLEIDFIPGKVGPVDFRDRLDYTIGSIHFVDSFDGQDWEADNTLAMFKEGLEKVFDNDIRKAVTRYFELMRLMMETSRPDIIAHMDRIKVHNQKEHFFDEQATWFRDAVSETLEAAARYGVMVEVNTRGLYKKRSIETYPGPFGIKRIAELGIPVMLASDAHHTDDLTGLFGEVVGALHSAGIRNLMRLEQGKWIEVGMESFLI